MLKLAGERAAGTTLWLADERTIGSHVVPDHHEGRRGGRAGPRPGSSPGSRSASVATTKSKRPWRARTAPLSEVEASPNYVRLMEHGDARAIGDVLVCGSEATMEKRLRSFADAGLTDFNARIVPLGEGREELKASAERTREFLASVAPSLRGLSFPSGSGPGRWPVATIPPDRKSQSWAAAWSPSGGSSLPLMVGA